MESPRPTARPDVVFRKVSDDWLLFDPRTQDIHVLNLAAALVWSHCTGEHTEEEIRGAVLRAFGDPVEGDPAGEALRRFREEGLLVGEGEGRAG